MENKGQKRPVFLFPLAWRGRGIFLFNEILLRTANRRPRRIECAANARPFCMAATLSRRIHGIFLLYRMRVNRRFCRLYAAWAQKKARLEARPFLRRNARSIPALMRSALTWRLREPFPKPCWNSPIHCHTKIRLLRMSDRAGCRPLRRISRSSGSCGSQ